MKGKKFLGAALILLSAIAAFPLIGCTANESKIIYESAKENEDEAVIEEPARESIDGTVVTSGSNYRITQTDEPFVLRYEILNNSGEVVRSFDTDRPTGLGFISDNVVELWVGVGTSTWWTVFYSVEDDILSEVFDSPIVITDELIGLLRRSDDDTINLIIRDMFDTERYYNEFLLEDVSRVANPIEALHQIKYLGNGRVEVTYRSGQNFVERTVIFIL